MKLKYILVVGAVGSLCVLPLLVGSTAQSVLTKMLIAALFAGAFNLLAGQAGLLSFGHAAYFGVGAIATLHFMAFSEAGTFIVPTPFLPLVGLSAGLVIATIAGAFATKRSGTYFSLVTLAFAELIHVVGPIWEGMFGGEAGLTAMRMPWRSISFASPLQVYYLVAAWSAIGLLVLWSLSKTGYGQLVRGLRNNEQRVAFLGFNTRILKTITFGVSGGLSGMAGALLALTNETANYTLFSPTLSIQILFFTFIGGTAYFFAPIVSAAVLTAIPFLISSYTRSWPLYQGLIFMIVMFYAPGGIGGWIHAKWINRSDSSGLSKSSTALELVGVGLLVGGAIVAIETISRSHVTGGRLNWVSILQSHLPMQTTQVAVGALLGVALALAGVAIKALSRRHVSPRILTSQSEGAR